MAAHLRQNNAKRDPHEQLDRGIAAPRATTVETGNVTPAMKVQRNQIEGVYAEMRESGSDWASAGSKVPLMRRAGMARRMTRALPMPIRRVRAWRQSQARAPRRLAAGPRTRQASFGTPRGSASSTPRPWGVARKLLAALPCNH